VLVPEIIISIIFILTHYLSSPSLNDYWVYSVTNYVTGETFNQTRTIVQSNSNFTIKIEVSNSDRKEFLYYTKDWVLVQRDIISKTIIETYTYSPGIRLFSSSLEIGKTWILDYDEKIVFMDTLNPRANRTSFKHHSFLMHVVASDFIAIRNQTYFCYVIDCNYTNPLGANQRWYRYWFSPDLNITLKEVTFTPAGSIFEQRELIEFKISTTSKSSQEDMSQRQNMFIIWSATTISVFSLIGVILFFNKIRNRKKSFTSY